MRCSPDVESAIRCRAARPRPSRIYHSRSARPPLGIGGAHPHRRDMGSKRVEVHPKTLGVKIETPPVLRAPGVAPYVRGIGINLDVIQHVLAFIRQGPSELQPKPNCMPNGYVCMHCTTRSSTNRDRVRKAAPNTGASYAGHFKPWQNQRQLLQMLRPRSHFLSPSIAQVRHHDQGRLSSRHSAC